MRAGDPARTIVNRAEPINAVTVQVASDSRPSAAMIPST